MTQAQWLRNPLTGVAYLATEILLERKDLEPCDPPGFERAAVADEVELLRAQNAALAAQLAALGLPSGESAAPAEEKLAPKKRAADKPKALAAADTGPEDALETGL